MGILLPPIAQVTNGSTSHMTLHHRNRSLDSALQKIPEVDVTPSPECENVTATVLADSVRHHQNAVAKQRDELASLGSDDSGILCGSDTSDTTRESSVEHLSNESRESLDDLDKPPKTTPKCQITNADHQRTKDYSVSVVVSRESASDNNEDLKRPPPKSSGMLRLLESKVFDVPMAMHYLFNSKEPGANINDYEVDFYLPQLVCMYIEMPEVAEVIHRYLVH
ncbi:hypothetical protein HUJ05_001231, partial [Dendroctonus ponderosae]